VAHELNQPLQAILGFAQEIEFAQSEDQRREFVGEIQKSARKMSKIIHQLRVFSRKSKEENDWVDLKFVIDETRKLLESQFRSQNITFVVNTHKVKDPVFANALQLEQVLVNFSTNARDAIRAAKREQGKIEITIFDRGPSYVLSFKDNGCGMSPSVKEKAMNPFFTTKEVGHGTGLGLSLSYTLIQKMGGHIDIQTQEGVGTEMILTLPKDYRNSQRRAL
jgi:two-component system NtrC family sensor kinase